VDFPLLFEKLYDMGMRRLMVEGGATVNWELIKQGLVDEIRLIHLPVVVGSSDAPSLVEGEGFRELSSVKRFRIKRVFQCGNQVITEYKRVG